MTVFISICTVGLIKELKTYGEYSKSKICSDYFLCTMTTPTRTKNESHFVWCIWFYRVFGQLDIMRRRSLHDGKRSAQIAPTPVEGHSFEDSVYPS